MASHAAFPQVYYNGAFNGVPNDIFVNPPMKVKRGMTDDGEIRPCEISWRFDNSTDTYRPSNPMSALYGQLKQYTLVGTAWDSAVIGVAEVDTWAPDQDPEFAVGPPRRGRRWVDMTAKGILARVSAWSEPIRSPMYRQILGYSADLRAYLPLEDDRATTAPYNAAPGGGAPFSSGVTYGGNDGPGGAGTAAALTASSRLGVPILGMSSTAGYQVFGTVQLKQLPTSGTVQNLVAWTSAGGDFYQWGVNQTTYQLTVTAQDGTVRTSSSIGFGTGGEPITGRWITFRIKCTQVGGNVQVEPAWYPQDASVLYGGTFSFAGSVSRPTNLRLYGNPWTDGALYSHWGVLATVADNLQSPDYIASFNGYQGETAGARFLRLCAQVGVTASLVGNAADTWFMGRQKPATILTLLKECMDTDDALIFDKKTSLSIVFRTRKSLTNQTAKITLTYPGDITPPLLERTTVAEVQNEVTVTQKDGPSATALLTSGPLSNLPVPTGIGSKKGSQDVNVNDQTLLPVLAGWHLSRRTIGGSRYDAVTIDLDKNPGLITAVNSVDVGDRIVITGREAEIIDLIVYGIEDTCAQDRRIVTFTCTRGDVYRIGVYDAASSRYQAWGSTLAGAQTSTSTSWTVTAATADDIWSQTAGTPGTNMYEWLVSGECVRVTAMGAPTGTGPFSQVATVVRSINGIVKPQVINEPVRLAPLPGRTAGAVRYTM